MNSALIYLWLALLRRKALRFGRCLLRPGTLIGCLAVASLFGVLFHYRTETFYAQIVRPECLVGGMWIMLAGSLFKGFLNRGLVFEPADLDFVFTRPFTSQQIVVYRLLPNYLFALAQGLAFLELFGPQLPQPILTSLCFVIFQVVCFHLAAAAAIYAGTISELAHHRLRWMMVGLFCLITALYLRGVWDIKLVPAWLAAPLAQWFFYPAVNLSDLSLTPFLRDWPLRWLETGAFGGSQLLLSALYLAGFAAVGLASFWLLLKLTPKVLETSLNPTTRIAARRLEVRQGRRIAVVESARWRSQRPPKFALFRGVGAILWKNLVVAGRSRRDLYLALAITLIATFWFLAVRWALRAGIYQDGVDAVMDQVDNELICATTIGFLAFLLQRTLRFDFRCDGHHLLRFRTLPFSPLTLVLAELAVPVLFCLAYQALGIVLLLCYASFPWPTMVLIVLTYPAVSLALNGVWNLHYLISARRAAGGKHSGDSAVGALLVVALSFLIFWPAALAADRVNLHRHLNLALATWLAVQYLVDFLLVLALARIFQRAEIALEGA